MLPEILEHYNRPRHIVMIQPEHFHNHVRLRPLLNSICELVELRHMFDDLLVT